MSIWEILSYNLGDNKIMPYGWFHLMFMGLTIAVTLILCIFFRNANDKTYRRIIFIGWIIIVVLEIYKQILYTWHFGQYSWYYFPFQFCSTPLYTLPVVALCKNEKIRDMFTAFITTFVFLGGFMVMLYPNDVFGDGYVGIGIQTMIHHGSQIVFGIYLMVYNRKKLSFKHFLSSIPLFAICCVIAIIINETMGTNMFFISRTINCPLPVLSSIYPLVPWPVFLVIYILGFSLLSFVVYSIAMGITKLTQKAKKKA